MNTTAYGPIQTVDQWRREIHRAFNPTQSEESSTTERHNWAPAVDIIETDSSYIVEADIPGVDPSDIEVTTEKGVLTIRGERSSEHEVKGKDYKRTERSSGVFFRRFTLPENADIESVVAKGAHGVLEVTIPKTLSQQPRRVNVNA